MAKLSAIKASGKLLFKCALAMEQSVQDAGKKDTISKELFLMYPGAFAFRAG